MTHPMKPVLLLSYLAMLCFVFNGTTLTGSSVGSKRGTGGTNAGRH